MSTDPDLRYLARQIHRLRRETRAQARASQAARRSVEVTDGPVSYYGEDGTVRLRIGGTDSGTYTVVETNPEQPPRPTIPDVYSRNDGVEIVWDGTFEDANTPIDFAYTEIHASLVPAFEATDATQVGTFASPQGGSFFLTTEPGVVWYFAIQAVNRSGVESEKSIEVEAEAAPTGAATDGFPPAASPTPVATGGVEALFGTWDPIVNADPVEYDVYVSGVTPVDPVELNLAGTTSGTFFVVSKPAGTYYMAIVARDADGPGPLGLEGSDAVVAAVDPAVVAAHQTAINNLQTDLDAAEVTLGTHNADIAALQVNLTAAQTDLNIAEANITTLNTDLDAAEITLGSHTTSIGTLQTDLNAAEGSIGTLITDLDAAEVTIAAHTTSISTLQTDLDTAEATLAGHTTSIGTLQTDLDAAEVTLGNHTTSINTLNTDLNTAEADIIAAKANITGLQGKFPIVSTDITDGAITTPKMTANSISGDRITANTLDAAKIVAGSITTDRMTANTIQGDRIQANTLDATKIVAGSITTDRMTANSIAGDRITANTLDAAKIVAGSITTDRMTANTISGDRIAANTLDAAKIVASSITAAQIAAGAITAEKLTIGTLGEGMIANGSFESITNSKPEGWDLVEGAGTDWSAAVATDAPSGDYVLTLTPGDKAVGHRAVPVVPGRTYSVRCYVKHTNGNGVRYIRMIWQANRPAGGYVTNVTRDGLTNFEGGIANNSGISTSTYTLKEFAWTAPAGAYWATLGFYNWGASTGSLLVDSVELREVIVSAQIADGAIITAKMVANSISGDRITANTLDAAKIVAGSITTDRMTANTIQGDRIAANTLDAAKIVAGSVTTDRMTANSITGDRITANTLDAAKIVAGSITTDRMTANSISGDRIAANTLDATKIVADSISAAQIGAGAVTANEILAGTITTNEILAGQAWIGTITADRIQSGTMSAAVIVGDSVEARGVDASGVWTGAVVGMSKNDGFYAYGATPAGKTLDDRDLYVSFPVDGKPNIISGQLTASTMLVTGGATFRSNSAIEASAKLVLNGDVKAPKNAPALATSYATVTLAKPSGVSEFAGLAKGHNGNLFTGLDRTSAADTIGEFNPTTGALIAERSFAWSTDSSRSILGLVYNPTLSVYHALGVHYSATNTWNYYIITLSTAFVQIGVSPIIRTMYPIYEAMYLGWDYTNSKPLTVHGGNTVTTWNLDGSGVVTTSAGTVIIGSAYGANNESGGVILRGTFDLGADRFVIKAPEGTISWLSADGTGASQASESWVGAGSAWHAGGYWDTTSSKFVGLTTAGAAVTYEGGDSFWTVAAIKWWVGYTWYDSAGTAHETASSPYASITMVKRAKLVATVDPVPGALGAEDPNSVNLYVGKLDGSVAPATTAMYKRLTLAAGTTTGTVSGIANGTALSAKAIDFSASAFPGSIESNDGGSYWKGDNTAKFLKLHLESSTDAGTGSTAATGSEPALRVGDIAGGHLRVDGNEIIAMSAPATQSQLYINRDGLVEIRGFMKSGIRNSGVLVANTDKTLAVGFNQAFPASGPVPQVVACCTGTTRNGDPQVSVANITRSGFDIVYKRANTTAIDAQWIATVPNAS